VLATLLPTLLLAAVATAGQAQTAPPYDARRARAAYERAVALEAEGNHAAALSLLWAAAGEAPGDADIQQRLGEALERLGALDAAIDAYEHALAARPASTRSRNSLVVALGKAGRGQDGVARARTWLSAAPGDTDGLFTLALAETEHDVEAAMAAFRQVLARRPADALAHYNLALLLKRVDRLDEAVGAAERSVELDARPEALLALGTLHAQRGDLDRAATAFIRATAAQPASFDAWLQLGAVRRARGDQRGAVEALRRAVTVRPDAWGAHAALAGVLARAGDEAGARRATDEAERRRTLERRLREAVTITAVGIARLDAGDAAGGLERFTAALAVDDAYAPAHYQRGRALRTLGRAGDAEAAFARARQLDPSLVAPPAPR
jgi:tetratricopeptide (TPR) repeat protein